MLSLPALPAALFTALALLAGCAGDGGSGTSPSAAPEPGAGSSTAAPRPEPDEPATPSDFPADTEPDTAEPSQDARLTVSDVRLGAQEGFDRVVFELGGAGTPGWDVRYVDEPTADGSGAPVEVAGESVLQVRITGAGYPFDTGVDEYSGPSLMAAAGTGAVTEVVFGATYEGVTSAFVGSTAPRPFRVYLAEDPPRVVVEVAHTG
ncbi:hypothetical protein GCU60_09750 [Blastococcus saxobsidens]|uniref:AMIN-like domain-containing protein n=1 Tax=Blastococcus saxobsidens TaxID=138336 RepID=A0A6L9W2I8_9ACTN|nr:hypothetical protein [Blastococcus saxobsidens]